MVESDGRRYAAWQSPDRTVTRVMDARTGAVFAVRTPSTVAKPPPPPPPPPGHPPVPFAAPSEPCRIAGTGGGFLGWDCHPYGYISGSELPPAARVMELRTRRMRTVRGLSRLRRYGADAYAFTGAGRHWLEGFTVKSPPIVRYLLNWRTGTVRSLGRADSRSRGPAPRTMVDLDRRHAVFRLCAPLRRRDAPSAPYRFEAPFGLAVVRGVDTALRLDRCGSRSRVLVRCRCRDARLGSGLVAWHDGRHVVLHRPRTGRRVRIPVPPHGSDGAARLALTARRVLVVVSDGPPQFGRWRTYAARIPG